MTEPSPYALDGKICVKCNKRPATIWWGDMLDLTHGFSKPWCEVCALEEQIEHAEKAASEIPTMKARYNELLSKEE